MAIEYPFADTPVIRIMKPVNPLRGNTDCPVESPTAIGHQAGENRALVWFSHWFICPSYYEYWFRPKDNGPVIWHRLHEKVVYTNSDTGTTRIWMLQNKFDEHGCRLGVWPD